MISGFLQAGAYNGLNGRYGLPGWKWLFIIDGVITVPIAILGFFIMPGKLLSSDCGTITCSSPSDLPSTTTPSWLFNEADIQVARDRMASVGRSAPASFTKKKVAGFFRTWHLYLLVPRKTSILSRISSLLNHVCQYMFWCVSLSLS
jgi:ACS family pantothenate transporter-like MFS transporter